MIFQALNLPGPPPASQNWHLWAHVTTKGATGILATGKVLPTDYQVVGLDANEDTFSFYGLSMNNPEWTQGVVRLACKCFHSTKNCSALCLLDSCPATMSKARAPAHRMRITLRGSTLSCVAAPMIAGGLSVLLLLVSTLFLFCLIGPKQIFPADPQRQRVKQQKALAAGQSMLALTDQDEGWGKWKPSDSRSSKDVVISNPVTVKQEETEPSKASSAGASPS